MKKCPYCAEEIQDEAKVCRYCGRMLDQTAPRSQQVKPEKVFVNSEGVFISSTRAQIGGVVYSMANITSVSVRSQSPSPALGLIIFVLGALISGGIWIVMPPSQSSFVWVTLLCSGLIFVGGIVGAVLIARGSKPNYILKIGSSSGETNALMSKDLQSIQNLAKAINQAMVERG